MTLTSFFLIYFVVWWLVIFAILPIGVQSVGESDERQARGVEEGAPLKPKLLKKVIITSIVAAIISAALGMAWPSISSWAEKESLKMSGGPEGG